MVELSILVLLYQIFDVVAIQILKAMVRSLEHTSILISELKKAMLIIRRSSWNPPNFSFLRNSSC
jgi:hypothetical protein